MAKFIELDHYDLLAGKAAGKRIINVDFIKELIGPLNTNPSITRVKLVDGDFIDFPDTLANVRSNIEAV
ncbi:MAG: hypothetical protein SGI96_22240 [Bacteroidota bacterium]|nr:hypothetical protein [Bacteroidota bacterium]